MSFFENARQSRFVKHEEKQENISRFAGFFLDRLSVVELPTLEQRTVTLLVRSAASPAARSLLAVVRQSHAFSVRLQVVFCQLDPAELLADWSDLSLADGNTPAVAELRWARRTGLSDAHEQMVLGLGQSWQGDCMRRDPETRDAFETYETINNDAARRSAAAFNSIWSKCDPIAALRPLRSSKLAGLLPHDVLTQAAQGALAGATGASISTRH